MEGGIDVLAWQAAEQGEALVKAGMVEATVDPGLIRVRKPSEGEYIPEVFYRWVLVLRRESKTDTDSFKNEYGLQVKMPAKPTFPVEYLYVNVS